MNLWWLCLPLLGFFAFCFLLLFSLFSCYAVFSCFPVHSRRYPTAVTQWPRYRPTQPSRAHAVPSSKCWKTLKRSLIPNNLRAKLHNPPHPTKFKTDYFKINKTESRKSCSFPSPVLPTESRQCPSEDQLQSAIVQVGNIHLGTMFIRHVYPFRQRNWGLHEEKQKKVE